MITTHTIEILFLLFFLSEPKPILYPENGIGVRASLPAVIFDEEEVITQLKSGLTSTFRIQVFTRDNRGAALEGGARVEIRYELWDEVYIIRTLEIDGAQKTVQITDQESLKKWWQATSLLVLLSDSIKPSEQIRLTLEFIPFSQVEQNNAREWLTESTGGRVSNPRAIAGERTPQGQNRSRIFSVIMATSIKRKVLVRYRWKLAMPLARQQEE